jgi:hypothetical protein
LKETPGSPRPYTRCVVRGVLRCAWILAGAVLLAASPQPEAMDEYVLKAQALVELSPYFKWPEQRDAGRIFTIAVVGRSPFGPKLDAYARSRTIQGRRIGLHYVQRSSELAPCDLIFICRSERKNAGEILDWARGKGILTVSDDPELLTRGVMVDLVADGGTLKLYVNQAVAVSEKFIVSSRLLGLAKLVDTH